MAMATDADRSIGTIIKGLMENISTLFRSEIALLKWELKDTLPRRRQVYYGKLLQRRPALKHAVHLLGLLEVAQRCNACQRLQKCLPIAAQNNNVPNQSKVQLRTLSDLL